MCRCESWDQVEFDFNHQREKSQDLDQEESRRQEGKKDNRDPSQKRKKTRRPQAQAPPCCKYVSAHNTNLMLAYTPPTNKSRRPHQPYKTTQKRQNTHHRAEQEEHVEAEKTRNKNGPQKGQQKPSSPAVRSSPHLNAHQHTTPTPSPRVNAPP